MSISLFMGYSFVHLDGYFKFLLPASNNVDYRAILSQCGGDVYG